MSWINCNRVIILQLNLFLYVEAVAVLLILVSRLVVPPMIFGGDQGALICYMCRSIRLPM